MMRIFLTILFAMFSCSANADWQISSFKDRMTDKSYSVASVAAKEADQSISATLQLACMNGVPMPSLILSAPMTRGQIGVNWRIDEAPQHPSFLHVFSDPDSIPFVGVTPRLFSGKKRFRITIFPTGSQTLFWEFDVSGADAALKSVKC